MSTSTTTPPRYASAADERVRANLRSELGRRELKQSDLADLLGMSVQSVSLRMTGRQRWHISELDDIARAWHIPIGWLVSAPPTVTR
jgi:transcriptional regulator with XRE-family HTH domain